MAVQANVGQQIVTGDIDLSCYIKNWQGSVACEALDTTAVCVSSGFREFGAGLKSWEFAVSEGMVNFADGSVDEKLNVGGTIGSTLQPLSVMPTGGAAGALAYTGKSLHTNLQILGAEVGQLAPFTMTARGKGNPLVRGQVMVPSSSAVTATGNGTGYQLGAITSSQSIFLALHVLAISGAPTFAAILQSDDNSGFTSATTRITSANYSASTGSEWQYLTGAVADDYWRVRYTVTGGTDPSITFLAVVGIATFS